MDSWLDTGNPHCLPEPGWFPGDQVSLEVLGAPMVHLVQGPPWGLGFQSHQGGQQVQAVQEVQQNQGLEGQEDQEARAGP